MSDSDNSQPQDDSDEDIYKDIPDFNFEEELVKLEGSRETYKQEANDLSDKVKLLTEENVDLKKSNEILKKNLSTLLKTAQAEVRRKDTLINELRSKVDAFTFRRKKTNTKDKYTSTDDLVVVPKTNHEPERSEYDRKSSKSFENRTSSDSDKKYSVEEEKKRDFLTGGKEDYIDCDKDRKSGSYRENSRKFKHSDNNRETRSDRFKDRNRSKSNSGHGRSFRENHRDHLKYDSFDKKRHSRSSDRRFFQRRRSSRDKDSHRRNDSSERPRRRSREKFEKHRNVRKRRSRSRSREISRDSSSEKIKTKSSPVKDCVVKNFRRENPNTSEPLFNNLESKRLESSLKPKCHVEEGNNAKNKRKSDKHSEKPQVKSNEDIFNTISPLDALYNDMVTTRSSNRFSAPKPQACDKAFEDSDFEEGEVSSPIIPDVVEDQPNEDWALSFKNERPEETRPMTLYSRRMLKKLSVESKANKPESIEEVIKLQEKIPEPEVVQNESIIEKEPGELTDDEQIVESSKEFQEIAKVASIQSEKTFKEPLVPLEKHKEVVKSSEVDIGKELELHDVIEFSPFKNNYKLIKISPIKPPQSEHVLEYYTKRNSTASTEEKELKQAEEPKPSDTSDSWKNSSSEKDSEAELKICVPSASVSPKEKKKDEEVTKKKEEASKKEVNKEEKGVGRKEQKKSGKEEVKETTKRKEVGKKERRDTNKKEEKELSEKEEKEGKRNEKTKPVTRTDSGRGKRKTTKTEPEPEALEKKETERGQRRKRKTSESDDATAKKRKVEELKPCRKSSRIQKNSKPEPPPPEPKPSPKEDITSFEFFKPVAKLEPPKTPRDPGKPICTTTDYKMTATMSVVRLETPNKCVEKVKNLTINEQVVVVGGRNPSIFSPLIGTGITEMTPRRMLKNDLMLTDSEDDSVIKKSAPEKVVLEEEEEEGEEVEEEEEEESDSEYSECDSDSGASDFVDLL